MISPRTISIPAPLAPIARTLLLAWGSGHLSAETVVYWRFEGDGTTEPTEGAYVQDTDGHTAVQAAGIPAIDLSGNGNNLYSWNNDYSGHQYQALGTAGNPFTTLPNNGEANNWAIHNVSGYSGSFTWSEQSNPTGTDLETWTSPTWTIEASFLTTTTNGHQTFVGRDGNGVSNTNAANAPVYFQITPGGSVRILYVDAAGNAHAALDPTPVRTNTWYSYAAISDGETLSLWRTERGSTFLEVASADLSESTNPALADPGVDANGEVWPWTVGRGRYGTSDNPHDNHGDRFYGSIDEVRISDVALPVEELLASFPTTAEDSDADGLPDSWETTNFGTINYYPDDDYDLDFSTNYAEYAAGTDPDDENDWPDSDDDGLGDGWEMLYLGGTLDGGPDEDPDGDYNTNLAEFLAASDPSSALSFPDWDDDYVNDGWELHYFPAYSDPEEIDVTLDPDGDLHSTEAEFRAETDPNDIFSSPDLDDFLGDSLPDGWEVYYFGQTGDDLETAVGRQGPTDDPDGDGFSNFMEYAAATDPTDAQSYEATLGYWRFEEASEGEVPAGGNGQYLYPASIQDSSLYGNHMMAWADYSRPNYAALLPAATIPATGESNEGSLLFTRNGNGVYYIEAVFTTPTAHLGGGTATLRTATFEELTVEASFRTEVSGVWQSPVAKFGNPVGGQPPFSFKVDTTDKLRLGLIDGSGVAREIISETTIAVGSWYSAAAVITADEMRLYLKLPGEASYRLEGSLAIEGAWHVPESGPENTVWNIGAGMWAGTQTDAFGGYLDEVRITAKALPVSAFLFHEESTGSPYELWAASEIPDPAQREAGADPDGDGTPNGIEFALALDPMDAHSTFTASLSDELALTWPAAEGLSFTIQTSPDLSPGSWQDVTTVTASGAEGTWPLPEASGTAFFRIVVNGN
ncbi:LamG-like jellyroll fold domain-containing protein [Roseibacillus ishigakijimensis]|uniref:Concanavalin A-like lectin/glucanases superfamily protein n=1 Tax=Roseibacillus ishigakijimensis TaxID=454146 RepID=A0A934RMH7_9BACT|nr:LamG-like jellyroll fold domain-containing protein [Roseibacillus ishigakijimensis]MBK1833543.1 hypothetical protein [Roseibacillus ishigakijimensis]